MEKIKKFVKNIIISFLIFYIIIANTSSSYARNFDDAARAFLAEQTENFINTYAGDSKYSLTVLPASFIGTTFHSCCTSGIAYVYNAFLGLNIYNLGFSDLAVTNLTSLQNENWTEISVSESRPGDILVRDGHAEMVASAGGTTHFNFGTGRTNANMNIHDGNDQYTKVFSLNENVQVTPSGTVPNTPNSLEEEDNATEDPADEFYYQGLAQGSFAGTSNASDLLSWLFNLISQLADYVAGFATMIIKLVAIGWANIFVNIVTDAVDAITGETVEAPVADSDNADGNSVSNTTTNTITSDTYEAQSILDNDNLYTPTSTELQPEGDDKLTIDKIVFNQIPLLDVNVFSDTAAGYTLKDDSSLQIVRDSVATWYYIIRNVTIAVMLVILIYIGIRMAISTIASEKAIYKNMLISWLVGFLIIFVIQYFLILVLNINSTILGWITGAQDNLGYEDSIYETVRTKAYEIKFSSGMVGTILYIILIILMLKFLYIYLKRFLAVCILTVMAPMMGASYAISKVRTGKAKAFTRWMKDYTLLVLIQSVHALIYTCFVTVVLQLTNESIAGIVLSLVVMNFMLKASDIFTNIFSMVGDKDGGSRSLDTILKSDPKNEIYEKLYVAKAAFNTARDFASGAVEFGKDIKSSLSTKTDRQKQVQAQALNLGNLGKKALGQSWSGIKNIDAATGQYVPKGKAEKLSSLSADLTREEKITKDNKKKERKKFLSNLYSGNNNKIMNALKITTALPLMGVSGYAGIGASNLVTGTVDTIANSVQKRQVKNKKSNKKYKLSSPISKVGEKIPKPIKKGGKAVGRVVGTTGKVLAGPVVAGAAGGIKDAIQGGIGTGEKIQDTYESRMAQIGQAKETESKIIDLYTKGRREKEKEFRPLRSHEKSDKVIKTIAKNSFDESYRRTIENVFEVSDIVDKRVDREQHLQSYKDELGIDNKTIGKNSIETVKEQVKQRAKNNISDKIRDKYQRENNYEIDETTERKIKAETEERLSKFMKDLDKEINEKIEKHEELENDPSVIKGDRFDYSETIEADKLKSTIEDVMKKHDADKKVDDGMEELRDQMHKLQRIDRDYANSDANKDKTYLYKFGTDISSADESKTNLKNVLSSLTFRNIDIDGGRR